MSFTLYPAIDLRQGRVVRLTQGRADAETVYGEDPVSVAVDFESQGATWLHVVNLDGAFGEATRNMEVLGAICEAVKIPVQFGGGLRGSSDIEEALGAGAARVILGTIALRKPALVKMLAPGLGAKLAVGIDARHGMVAVEGWVETSDVGAAELAQRMMEAGVKRFVYTDIGRDGMLTGPDLEGAVALQALGVPVIASGGVGDIAHVQQARQMGVDGLIVGKALYEGRFTVRQALSS